MVKKSIDTLIKKYRENSCTPEEFAELEGWYEQFEKEAETVGLVPREKLDLLYQQIERKVVGSGRRPTIYSKFYIAIAVAAILLLMMWGGNYFLLQESDSPEKCAISPGRYQAELILSDGSRLALDSTTVVTEKNGVLIKEQSEVVLDYSRLKTSGTRDINMIKVPIGGEYRVILADGTRVWLNSGSSLKYPMMFGENKREVILTGEGYFEVATSAVPFVVKTSHLDVRVMGTSFDVSAYEEDEIVTTSLVAGKVQISGEFIRQPHVLIPGHILTYSKDSEVVSVEECDTELYTSWINGEFKFRNMRLEDIMVRLNRWYDCAVSYADPALKELHFSGAAERDRPINYLLQMIESITDVRFEIVGNKILVKYK